MFRLSVRAIVVFVTVVLFKRRVLLACVQLWCVLSHVWLFHFGYLCLRSTSPPGGDQVDGLPPALSVFKL